jgi:hypothetical protein
MNLFAFLIALVGPLMARILVSCGVSLVVMTGALTALSTVKSMVVANIGSLPATAIQLGGLLGIWAAIGLVFGTMTFCITWKSSKGFIGLGKV